jgi:hypothetical protein
VAVIGDGVNDAGAAQGGHRIAWAAPAPTGRRSCRPVLTNDDFRHRHGPRGGLGGLRQPAQILHLHLRQQHSAVDLVLAAHPGSAGPNRRQILAIDLGTDILPALALGAERPEPNVMRRPPRRRNAPLLDTRLFLRAFLWLGMIEAALCWLAFALVYSAFGLGGAVGLPAWPWLQALNPLALSRRMCTCWPAVFFAGS